MASGNGYFGFAPPAFLVGFNFRELYFVVHKNKLTDMNEILNNFKSL